MLSVQLRRYASQVRQNKVLLFGEEARWSLFQGMQEVERAVSPTLGPFGRNAALEYEKGAPKITKDGVTVGKNVMLRRRSHEMGAALMRSVGHKLNSHAGDGTTTSMVLATAIVKEGLKHTGNNGVNLQDLRRGLLKAGQGVVDFLEEVKTEVGDRATLEKVALVASNHDPSIAGLVTEALVRVGGAGSVLIEAGNTQKSLLYVTEGLNISRGVPNQRFLKREENRVEMSNAYVLIYEDSLDNTGQLMGVLNQVRDNHRSLLIMARDVSQQVLTNLVYLREKDLADVVVLTVPGQGQFTTDTLHDFALVLGTQVYSEASPPAQAQCHHLGKAQKVIVGRQETHITPSDMPQAQRDKVKARIAALQQERALSSQGNKQILGDRINRLLGRQAVILCGGGSETEMQETRDRLVDALNSCKQALSHGVLPGGGVALLRSVAVLDYLDYDSPCQGLAKQILSKALQQPLRTLLNNGGHLDPAGTIHKIQAEDNLHFGYDLKAERFCDLMEEGVIDSANAVKCVVQDSVSLASLVLTTECVVANQESYTSTRLSHYGKIEV